MLELGTFDYRYDMLQHLIQFLIINQLTINFLVVLPEIIIHHKVVLGYDIVVSVPFHHISYTT